MFDELEELDEFDELDELDVDIGAVVALAAVRLAAADALAAAVAGDDEVAEVRGRREGVQDGGRCTHSQPYVAWLGAEGCRDGGRKPIAPSSSPGPRRGRPSTESFPPRHGL